MSGFGSWFRGVRGRLVMIIALPLAVLSVVAGLGVWSVASLQEDLMIVSKERIPRMMMIADMRTSMHAATRFMWLSIAHQDADKRSEAMQEVQNRRKVFDDSWTKLQTLNLSEKARGILQPVADAWTKVERDSDLVLEMVKKKTPEADQSAKQLMLESLATNLGLIGKALREADDLISEQNDQILAEAERNGSLSRTACIVASILGFLATMIIGLVTASRLASVLDSIATRISEGGTQVSAASEQLSAASQSLSASATEAASALAETVASVEELSSMVKLNADNAKEAAGISQASRQAAEEGETEIRRLNEAMGEISQSSKKIEEIINVIDDIAFQTNLLALNAAVEAARAGEQGKGFAVVADAVRTLAQRSAAAAKDITSLIKDSVAKIDRGATSAEEGAKTLKTIVSSVKRAADLNNEIASASQEQSNGLAQISKAMNDLDQATQRNATSAEETASASEEMSSQAILLQEQTSSLKVLIDGIAQPVAVETTGRTSGRGHVAMGAPGGGRRPTSVTARRAPLAVVDKRPAAQVIPFDSPASPESLDKVGTTDGF